MLTWLHMGDLHLTDAREPNHNELIRIIAAIERLPPGGVDFVLLPGDNADDGTPAQFQLLRDAIARLPLPLHILPGDHDYKPKTLDAFHDVLGAHPLPYSAKVKGHRCLFLDVVSAGTGGPDFRLTDDHLDWIEREIASADAAGEEVAVFMHSYPADLTAGGARLNDLLAARHVLCVDMGHTHYNELANNGRTIFMATRSTGQIEEGPAGFSIAVADRGGMSWRFKEIDTAWPCVLVTHPVDRRLATDKTEGAGPPRILRAKLLGDAPMTSVVFSTDDTRWHPMSRTADDATVWEAPLPGAAAVVTVRAEDAQGRQDRDVVELADAGWTPPPRIGDGSDKDRIGAWPAKGLFDTQLGPNRNGRKW